MKEWTGNKNSVASMLGMKTIWNPEQRAAGDYYTTDPTAVEAIIPYIKENNCNFIWECACGCGNISKKLLERNLVVFNTDLFDRGFGITGIDFLNTDIVKLSELYGVQDVLNIDAIVTNPPYKYATEFIIHALDILPENGIGAFFLNISYLTGKDRYKRIYSKGGLEKVIIFSNRVNCYKNNIPSGHSSPVNYAWYIFRKGYTLAPVIEWATV